jgi:hypothetical protein
MSTNVGLFLAAALPPALSSGKPSLVLSYICQIDDISVRFPLSYLGESLVGGYPAYILMFDHQPRQAPIKEFHLGDWFIGSEVSKLCRGFKCRGPLKGESGDGDGLVLGSVHVVYRGASQSDVVDGRDDIDNRQTSTFIHLFSRYSS